MFSWKETILSVSAEQDKFRRDFGRHEIAKLDAEVVAAVASGCSRLRGDLAEYACDGLGSSDLRSVRSKLSIDGGGWIEARGAMGCVSREWRYGEEIAKEGGLGSKPRLALLPKKSKYSYSE